MIRGAVLRVRAAIRRCAVVPVPAVGLLAGLASCGDPTRSALHPAAADSARVDDLYRLMLVVSVVVWMAVMLALVIALLRSRRRTEPLHDAGWERRARLGVLAAAITTAFILVGLLAADLSTGRALGESTRGEAAVTIELVGSQWWWEAHYEATEPAHRVTTANELHIPVGRSVLIKLRSRDVIHSAWIPNLNGKQDLTPGYTNTLWLQADRPGVYRGRCAEYCGHQHAHMELLVIAQTDAEFQRWLEAQRRPATEPTDDLQRRGRDIFLSSTCIMCHTVRGTGAGGRLGPDLTHVGSRRTLGAGTLPNDTASLMRWIADPQRVKPGVRMPSTPLRPDELQALAAWLVSLR